MIIFLQELPSLHVEILRHELGAQTFIVQYGVAHALALEDLAEFLEIVPAQVSAKMLVEIR
jgi:hypothetical protein